MTIINMTIDEAIKHERELSDCCKKMFDDMNEADKISNTLLKNEIEEHEQLAKWLEELKAYRESGTVEGYKSAIECYTEEYIRRKSNEQYNKAIDDFVKFANTMPTVETEDGEIRPMWLEEMAEQLKAGVKE